MQSKKSKAKGKRQLVYKPYLKGNWHSGQAALRGLRILGYYLAFAFVFLLMGAILSFNNAYLRWGVNLFVEAVCAMVLFASGARDGEGEVSLGEIAYAHQQEGRTVPSRELGRCYHPLKGWFTFLCAAAVLLALTLPHALTAQKQTYTLQALPTWLSSFRGHEEITAPLNYYQQEYSLTFLDALRIAVRLLILPFANAVGARNADGLLLMDRISPLLALLPALGYPVGYLTGPRTRAMVHGDITANQRRRQRREKKARQARNEKKNELI